MLEIQDYELLSLLYLLWFLSTFYFVQAEIFAQKTMTGLLLFFVELFLDIL